MTATTIRRPALLAAALVALLVVIGAVTAVLVNRDDGEDAARDAAERYLRVLADADEDPGLLADLVVTDDAEALAHADDLLTQATARITGVSLGDGRETATAPASSDLTFDRFVEFDVAYELVGERHDATITLGLPRGDEAWLVVTPLAGQVDWNAAAWGTALPDLTVGDVATTEPGRRTYEPEAQLVHPAVYPLAARVGPYFGSEVTELAVATDPAPTPLPDLDLSPTPEGTSAIVEATLAAFDPCTRGTASCPVVSLVPGDDELPPGWWGGLVSEPSITVDGTSVTLSNGAFRATTADGRTRTFGFSGSTTVTVDPRTGEPGVALPIDVERRPAT